MASRMVASPDGGATRWGNGGIAGAGDARAITFVRTRAGVRVNFRALQFAVLIVQF